MQTTGFIQRMNFIDVPPTRGGCVWIGPSPWEAELFTLYNHDTDPEPMREHKSGMLDALASALASRLTVIVSHNDTSGVIYELGLSSAGS